MAKRHPNKHIHAAIRYAEERGWTFEKGRGHAYGKLRCGHGCFQPVWSTPRNKEAHARDIRRAVERCPHCEEPEPDAEEGQADHDAGEDE